jgi:hypothetical protein
MMNGECNRVALTQRNYLGPRLHSRSLFGEYELPPLKISPRFGEKECHLYRKDMFAIEVLVQTVIVSRALLQKQRRWA